MLCCLVDNTIIVCSVCGKSAEKTQNQMSIEESKFWYVKRGDPTYCRKCLVSEKMRLKQELEAMKAVNTMQEKKRKAKSKSDNFLKPILDGKAWKKSRSFMSSFQPSQRALDLAKRAEKRAQNKQEIKQTRKETFSYDLRKELEIRRKLAKLERGTVEGGIEDSIEGSLDVEERKQRVKGRRRSSIVDFFKKFTGKVRRSSFTMPGDEYDLGTESGESGGDIDIITPVGSNQNTPDHTPRSSFDINRGGSGPGPLGRTMEGTVTGTNFQSNSAKDPSPNSERGGKGEDDSFPHSRSFSSSNNGEFDSIAELAELEESECEEQEYYERDSKKSGSSPTQASPAFDETLDMSDD